MKVLEIMANFVQIGQTAKDELKKKKWQNSEKYILKALTQGLGGEKYSSLL